MAKKKRVNVRLAWKEAVRQAVGMEEHIANLDSTVSSLFIALEKLDQSLREQEQ